MVLLLDQAVKVFIKLGFSLTERVTWIPGAFDIQFIENDGMAFGWALPGASGKYLLTAFRIVAVVLLSIHVARVAKQGAPRGFRQALGFNSRWCGGQHRGQHLLWPNFYEKLFRSGC